MDVVDGLREVVLEMIWRGVIEDIFEIVVLDIDTLLAFDIDSDRSPTTTEAFCMVVLLVLDFVLVRAEVLVEEA